LIDLGEIWHAGADWPRTGGRSLKFPKKQDGGGSHLEKPQKSRYHNNGIDRSSRNLARLCKMGLLTVQMVEKFELPKSKMADGRHFENT